MKTGRAAFWAMLVATTLAAGGGLLYLQLMGDRPAPADPALPTSATAAEGTVFSVLETPQPVPELRFVDGQRRERKLAEFRGKAVLLNLWATWCVPCRKEMPALDRLQTRLGGSDFEVAPLSIDRKGLPVVEAFYAELGLEALPIYVDATGEAVRELKAPGIPTTLLLDRQGREIGRALGEREWDSEEAIEEIERLLGWELQPAQPEAAVESKGVTETLRPTVANRR
jgi:thiol-disulfide isomerase/thioredoxin